MVVGSLRIGRILIPARQKDRIKVYETDLFFPLAFGKRIIDETLKRLQITFVLFVVIRLEYIRAFRRLIVSEQLINEGALINRNESKI